MDINVFMDISLQLSLLLLVSMDFYGYPCIDLLWILDPGFDGRLPSVKRKKSSELWKL